MRRALLLTTFSILVTSCVTIPQLAQPMEKTRTVNAAYDDVWKAAINALTTSNQMITMSEKDSGVMAVDRTFERDQIWEYALIDGWTKFWTIWTGFRSRANLVIQSVTPEKTRIVVNAQIFGDFNQSNANYFTGAVSYTPASRVLSSNGKLEKEYLDIIEAQLSGVQGLEWANPPKESAAPPAGTSPVQSNRSAASFVDINQANLQEEMLKAQEKYEQRKKEMRLRRQTEESVNAKPSVA